MPWGLLGLTVGLTCLHSLLFDSNAGGTGYASIPSLDTYASQSQAVNIPGELLLRSTVLAIIVARDERHKTATGTYHAIPYRVRVLVAKATAVTASLLFGLAGAGAAIAIGLSFAAAGVHHLLLSPATIAR